MTTNQPDPHDQPDIDRARRRAIRALAQRIEDPRVHAMLEDVLRGRKTLGQFMAHPAFMVLFPPRRGGKNQAG